MRSAVFRFRMGPNGPAGSPKPGFLASCLALVVGLAAAVLALSLAAFVFLAGLVVLAFLYVRRLLRGGAATSRPSAPPETPSAAPEAEAPAPHVSPEDQAELEQFHGNLDEWFAQKRHNRP